MSFFVHIFFVSLFLICVFEVNKVQILIDYKLVSNFSPGPDPHKYMTVKVSRCRRAMIIDFSEL